MLNTIYLYLGTTSKRGTNAQFEPALGKKDAHIAFVSQKESKYDDILINVDAPSMPNMKPSAVTHSLHTAHPEAS